MPLLPTLPGVDTELGLSRAGGALPLYLRFLKRFPEDDSFSKLLLALDIGDLSSAFLCAHTLKGLCAQLGITALGEPVSELCELLRPLNPAILPSARQMAERIQPVYVRICESLCAL